MNKPQNCRTCGGIGSIPQTKRIGAHGIFGWRETCHRCEGTGLQPPRDPWTVPTIIFVALIAAYFIWQLFIR